MLSGYLQKEWNHLSFVMATRGLQAEFPSLYLVRCAELLSLPAPPRDDGGSVTLASEPGVTEGTTSCQMCYQAAPIAAVIFHIKGHDLTLIVRVVGGVLMYSRTNVRVFTNASF